MRNRLWLAGWTLLLALSACNLNTPLPTPPTTVSSPQGDSATEVPTRSSSTPRPTPLPLNLPTYTPTSTPGFASVRPKDELVNCRFGPGTVYSLIGELEDGQSARITGKNSDGSWYYIKDPGNPDGFCWVSANFVDVTGNTEDLPIVLPPAPSVTEIVLTVQPNLMTVSCDAFPQVVYFTAEVTTNAPALVTYRWEVSTGVSSVDNAIAFEEASTQTISEFYQIIGPNDYWIRLHVLGPNVLSEEAKFRVNCNR